MTINAPAREHSATSNLDRTIKQVRPRTSANKLKQLDKMGISTVRDLLMHLPRHYENRSRITQARNAREGQRQTFEGYITEVKATAHGAGPGRQTATIYDTREDLERRRHGLHILWFGQRHLVNRIDRGDYLRLNGMVNASSRTGFVQLYQPEYDILSNWESPHRPAVNTGAIIPIYPLTQGMTQDYLRHLIRQCLEDFRDDMTRSRPGKQQHTLSQILWTLHFPKEAHHPAMALEELAADEVLELQMALLHRREEHLRQGAPKPVRFNPAITEAVHRNLPFELTPNQSRAIAEIRDDLVSEGPTMNRLLQGEVGSGKTVVALSAAVDVTSATMQSAILAPTELLAEQHFNTIAELVQARPSQVEKGLMECLIPGLKKPFVFGILTSSTKAAQRRKILQNLSLGYIDLIIGTHSLLSQDVKFRDLGLAITDEQHRFGTEQRAALRQQAHYLMLTATPIPRTLQLTLYRDLDISSIDRDRDAGRAATRTEVLPGPSRETVWQAIQDAVKAGRQAFVVCPFIEASDAPGADVVTTTRAVAERFPDFRVDGIHGRMKNADQDRHMRGFRDGDIDVLVATPVIEVGIDVPNATVMAIQSAERFGMAQLHQLRGRIGRGEHPGTCFLIPTKDAELAGNSRARLDAVAASNNGLELAEADLRNRGEGHLTGSRQSGHNSALRAARAYSLEMLETERRTAESIHARDPGLSFPENRELKAARDRMLVRLRQEADY